MQMSTAKEKNLVSFPSKMTVMCSYKYRNKTTVESQNPNIATSKDIRIHTLKRIQIPEPYKNVEMFRYLLEISKKRHSYILLHFLV